MCEEAGAPLEVVPLTDEYWDRVVSHSIAETRAGRTPNPDVWCNSRSAKQRHMLICGHCQMIHNTWHATIVDLPTGSHLVATAFVVENLNAGTSGCSWQ